MMEVGIKRRIREYDGEAYRAPVGDGCLQRVSRSRVNPENALGENVDIMLLLKSDRLGFDMFDSRLRALLSVGLTEEDAKRLFIGLRGEVQTFLKIVDLNEVQGRVCSVLQQLKVSGSELHSLNVKSCAIGTQACRSRLLDMVRRRISDQRTCNLIEVVLRTVFTDEEMASATIMYGGGVRDILLADYCRFYRLQAANWKEPAFVMITAQPSGRNIFVPLHCF